MRVTADHVIAVTGGDLSPTLNDAPLPMWRAIPVHEGDVIAFTAPRRGVRAYLAVAGGIDVPSFLGSRATNVRAAVGGVDGRGLKTGDRLRVGTPARPSRSLRTSHGRKTRGRSWGPPGPSASCSARRTTSSHRRA